MPRKKKDTPRYDPVKVDLALELLSRGLRSGQVAKALGERFRVTARQAQKYIAEARRLFAAMSEEKREDQRGRVATYLWRVARDSEGGDGGTGVAAMRELSKLFGLYEPERKDVNVRSATVMVVPPPAATEAQWAALAGTSVAPQKKESK